MEPTALDNCSIQSLTSDIPSGAAFITGTTTVTYSATDINGNTSNHQFAVTVMDVQNPEIMGMPASISLSSESGSCEATASWVQPTTGDNCSVLSFSGSHVSGTSFPVGTTSVAYTAVDTSGNTTVETFTVTVADLEGPSIVNLPADINLANDQGLCGAIVSWIEPTTADNCGSASMTSSHQPGSFFPVGETEVQYVSVDSEGNSFASSFNVLVVDQELPEITGIPTDITIFADPGQCSGIHTWIDPVATDNCTVSTLEVTQGPGSAFLVGTTSVIYTVIDQAGHSVTSSFVVTVLDDQAPEILGTPSDILVTAEVGQCTAPATWIPANATDNCSIETFISSHNSGDVFPLGSNVVTYSATDASGNSSDTTFVVQVIDDQAPEITGMPAAFSISADQGECGAIVSWTAPVSSDNCGLNDLSSDIANGSFLAVGITTVT
ncbi:MAG: HYR domain-containing protein, partial [Pseudomonadales bacterium]|nr:HYR domain-containing protein [Pseudomonadales bacterium]